MEERETSGGALRVGMRWGVIGGIVGFVASLLGSLVGILVAVFVGVSCGRRAAADGGESAGAGALAGLVSGAVAAPVYVVGASAGALVAARTVEMKQVAFMLSNMLDTSISADEAWRFFLVAVVFAAALQAGVFVVSSVAAGAWVRRKP
ncbi:MAG TPA: hypothetical protein VHM16_04355 [Rubrobacteraceae bacterium]|nr:hypothetical protein [Rubrobacteraceae bacterium]